VNNQANTQDIRNVIGFSDIGEHPNYLTSNLNTGQLADGPGLDINTSQAPSNLNNDIYNDMIGDPDVMSYTGANAAISAMGMGYQQGIHYERVGNARKLTSSEYTFNTRLGFISLRQALNNAEVLAVSYEYTLGGQTFQVGTLSQDGFCRAKCLDPENA